MNVNELKNKVLQLAIQGKLVEQNPEDTPASALLEEIRKEKEQLIKDKKIKKEKALPEITDEEKSFELPTGWEWCRLGEIANIIMGQSPDSTSVSEDIDGIEFHQGKTFFGETLIKQSGVYCNKPSKIALKGDILLSVRAPVGALNITDRDICIGRGLTAIRSFNRIRTKYYYYFIKALEHELIKRATGTTFLAVSSSIVKELIIPLPPIQEQQRITEKVEELFSIIEKLADNKEEMIKDISNSRNKVLQLAIQGKLVKQNDNDEPVAILLERINFEKQQLIRDKKIKKEKSLQEIGNEEKTFKLPIGWEWCKVGDLVSKLGAGSTPTGGNKIYTTEGIKFIRSQNVRNEGLILEDIAYIPHEINEKMKGSIVEKGDILLNITGASIGRSCIVKNDFDIGNVNQHVCIVRLVDKSMNKFIHTLIISEYFQQLIREVQVGVSREGLSMAKLKQFAIPLPPLEEQKRIVKKVDEIMSYLDELEKTILNKDII